MCFWSGCTILQILCWQPSNWTFFKCVLTVRVLSLLFCSCSEFKPTFTQSVRVPLREFYNCEKQGPKLKSDSKVLLDIRERFENIEQVKALAQILLEDGEKVVRRGTVEGHVSDVPGIAQNVLIKWTQHHPDESYGACLHAVLMNPKVDAAAIAREFEGLLLKGKPSTLLRNAELYSFLALNSGY